MVEKCRKLYATLEILSCGNKPKPNAVLKNIVGN
jgi:hypothetical protein